MSLAPEEITTRIRLIDNDLKVCRQCVIEDRCGSRSAQVMRSETLRLQHEQNVMKEKIRDNGEKVKQNKVLPYLVGNVVEVRQSSTAIFPLLTVDIRFSTLIQKARKTVPTATLTLCARGSVRS